MKEFFEHIFVLKYTEIEKGLSIDKRTQTLCAISALVSLGNHDFLQSYIKFALNETLDIEEIQEVILQCYLFAGFPAAIEGFIVLKTVQDKSYKTLAKKNEKSIEFWRDSGMKLCKKIYAENYDKMKQNIDQLNPDLSDWMITDGYGKTLSRSGLQEKSREFCAISSLAVLGWHRQVHSHCKGAINLGAKKEEIHSILLFSELFKRGLTKKYQYILDHL